MAMMMAGLTIVALTLASCAQDSVQKPEAAVPDKAAPPGSQVLVVGGGCFWCTEAVFEELQGVVSVEAGYAGGTVPNATYEQVCSGTTGHAEVIKITFDPKQISERDLLRIFFTVHDPTTLDRQGPDSGTQYRSVVFYSDDKEKELATSVIAEVEQAKIWPHRLVTTVEPLKNYTKAEDYHQAYYDKFESADAQSRQAMNGSYCTFIIEPKVEKFRHKYADRLKKKPLSH
jgi:peptide-methionine (S)-S-oxide reductase